MILEYFFFYKKYILNSMPLEKQAPLLTILKNKIKTPLIWVVISITFALTALFYTSQNQNSFLYNRYVETLSDYKFLEARLMISLEKIKTGVVADSSTASSQIMSIRELVISISSSTEHFRNEGDWMPPYEEVLLLEKEMFKKTTAMRQYVAKRVTWSKKLFELKDSLYAHPSTENTKILKALDSAQHGHSPTLTLETPNSVPSILEARALLAENIDLANLWHRFDNDNALVYSENLLQAFKMKALSEKKLLSKIPQIFYLLSILLLLSTLFFVFKDKSR